VRNWFQAFTFKSQLVPLRLGEIEDRLAAAGIKVFSISPHARFDPANPLSVPEANPQVLAAAVDHAAALGVSDPAAATLSLVKSPNCVTCGVVVALKVGLAAFHHVTLQ
jgi:aspartate-semialdehyde dehydrogenase